MEYLDIRRVDGSVTGKIKERTKVHEDGDLHGTVHIFIKRKNDVGREEVLLQKRSRDKDSFPGCYDISSAGHVSAGQNYMEAAVRELSEELGIKATEEELRFIGYHEGYSEEIFYDKPFRNHEISAVYLYENVVDEKDLVLQIEEIESVKWFDLEKCIEEVKNGNKKYCLFADELEMIKEKPER